MACLRRSRRGPSLGNWLSTSAGRGGLVVRVNSEREIIFWYVQGTLWFAGLVVCVFVWGGRRRSRLLLPSSISRN